MTRCFSTLKIIFFRVSFNLMVILYIRNVIDSKKSRLNAIPLYYKTRASFTVAEASSDLPRRSSGNGRQFSGSCQRRIRGCLEISNFFSRKLEVWKASCIFSFLARTTVRLPVFQSVVRYTFLWFIVHLKISLFNLPSNFTWLNFDISINFHFRKDRHINIWNIT